MLPSSGSQFTVMVNRIFASSSIRQPIIAWPPPSTGPQFFSGPDLSAVRHPVRIGTEYQIQDFDVFSIGLETRCPVGAKPSVEI
jgi:hypothetical protein